jgi:hypothetical protein
MTCLTKIPTDDAMPSRAMFLVELLLDIGSDILFDGKLLQSLSCKRFELEIPDKM